jgi:phosphoribosylformylglycinamidine synthase I
MKIAIVQFPGSNCERETILAVKRAGMEPVEFLWNEPKEKLESCDGYIIVGGFSYEDRSRSGAIAALDPIMDVIKQQSKLGKPVLGICNGAQILVETGLVPGIENDKIGMTLTDNKRIQKGKILGTGFYNAWINMRLSDQYQLNAFTLKLTPKDILHIPVAHGEGRFNMSLALLAEVKEHGLNVFQYCDTHGSIIDEFPVNPNGSIDNIAAISNKAGNVMAMMPHPERTTNGDAIFRSMREYIEKGQFQPATPLSYYPRPADIKPYQPQHHQLIIDLIITDNQALSVENALNHIGIPITIKRQIHWEVECDSLDVLEKIKASGVLFNDRKERLMPAADESSQKDRQHQARFLVRSKEDMTGKQKQQMLEDHFNIKGIKSIRHGVLWQVTAANALDTHVQSIINSNILFNPYAHDYYQY